MNRNRIMIFFSICILLLMAGCERTDQQQETITSERILTAVVETVSANLSLTPQAVLSAPKLLPIHPQQ